MLYTIITVCYNAQDTIRTTINSVLQQNYMDFEYIVIDGKSYDLTFSIVKKYRDEFNEKGIAYRYISEPDTGIYNAMNKAIEMSRGDWLLFLNAGDYFVNSEVLKKISLKTQLSDKSLIYGNYICECGNQFKAVNGMSPEMIRSHMPTSHQSMFFRNSTIKKYMYDEAVRFVADYDLVLRMYLNQEKIEFINEYIAVFLMDGVSTKGDNYYLVQKEVVSVQQKHDAISEEDYNSKISIITLRENKKKRFLKLKRYLKNKCPSLVATYLKKQRTKNGWSESVDKTILLNNPNKVKQ